MDESINIRILGDICPSRRYCSFFDDNSSREIFGRIFDELHAADVVIANLEAPISGRGSPIKKCGACLRGKPEDAKLLREANISALSLANNHILDYGPEALKDTIHISSENHIATFGAGDTIDSARRPLFFHCKKYVIGVIAFCEEEFSAAYSDRSGANLFDPYVSITDIYEAKKRCDCLIVLYHGGIENYEFPSPLLQKKCHKMVDAGVDVILCQHSHCIGTRERYKGAEILYGQGNALFGRMENDSAWNRGLLANINISQDGVQVSYRLFEATNSGIEYVCRKDEERFFSDMEQRSEVLAEPASIRKLWIDFCNGQRAEYFPALYGFGRVWNKINRVLNNALIRLLISRKKQRTTMNLIRCDAHREVVQTILEETQKK